MVWYVLFWNCSHDMVCFVFGGVLMAEMFYAAKDHISNCNLISFSYRALNFDSTV